MAKDSKGLPLSTLTTLLRTTKELNPKKTWAQILAVALDLDVNTYYLTDSEFEYRIRKYIQG